MTQSRIAALGAAGALAVGLAACGGGSSDGGGASSGDTSAAQTQTQTTSTQASTTADASGATDGLTPPGTHLALGKQAMVAWVPPSADSITEAQAGYKLGMTVDGIERGTIDDFKNIQLDAGQKQSTPYYVKVTIKSLDDVDVSRDDPDVTLRAIDDRGQGQSRITFFGEFPRCDDKLVPRPFPEGKSYRSCFAFLMPGDGSIDSVEWNDGPSRANEVTPYFDQPVVWGGS